MNNLIGRLWRTLLVRNEILLKSCTNDVHVCVKPRFLQYKYLEFTVYHKNMILTFY